jgi:hypothetical protein
MFGTAIGQSAFRITGATTERESQLNWLAERRYFGAPAAAYLFPVLIRSHFLLDQGVDVQVLTEAFTRGCALNGIDRRGQCSQLWRFVFHGRHLLLSSDLDCFAPDELHEM